jgi:hypothetical protein
VVDLESCRSLLLNEARRLSGQCNIPVPAAAVSKRLGVRLRRTTLNGAEALLVNADSAPEILLSGSPSTDSLTSWERFLVAHELGHFIMQRASIPKPLGKSEYWEQEHLCNAFARWLLVPESCVRGFQQAFENAPQAKLNLALHIERRAKVPWAVAAYRVAESNPNFVFLGLTYSKERLKVNVSTLPQKKEIGRLIDAEAELTQTLSAISQHRIVQALNIRYLSALPTLAQSAAGAAAVRTSSSEFRIAVQTL